MRCFYHANLEAIGICKSCQRGLCRECAVEMDKGLACQGRCEEDVRRLIALIEQNIRHQPAANFVLTRMRRTRIAAAVFYFVMGAGFIAWGFMYPFLHFVAVLGIVFVGYGIFVLTQLPKGAEISADGNTER